MCIDDILDGEEVQVGVFRSSFPDGLLEATPREERVVLCPLAAFPGCPAKFLGVCLE